MTQPGALLLCSGPGACCSTASGARDTPAGACSRRAARVVVLAAGLEADIGVLPETVVTYQSGTG